MNKAAAAAAGCPSTLWRQLLLIIGGSGLMLLTRVRVRAAFASTKWSKATHKCANAGIALALCFFAVFFLAPL